MSFSPSAPASNAAKCEKLQKEKEDLEWRFEEQVRELGWRQQAELQDLEERLQVQFQAEAMRLQEAHHAQLLRIKCQHQEQVSVSGAGLWLCCWDPQVEGGGEPARPPARSPAP